MSRLLYAMAWTLVVFAVLEVLFAVLEDAARR